MSSSDKTAIEDTESQSRFEKIMNSPIRLLTFCAALLIFSLMSGMMIGSIIKDRNRTQPLTSTQVQEVFKPNEQVPIKPVEADNQVSEVVSSEQKRPIDALEHDPSDYRNAPEYVAQPSELPVKPEIEVAAIPPSEIKQAFPEIKDTAWRKFAIPVTIKSGAPLISIVIDDVGLNSKRVEQLLALPTPLTLAYLPYADNLQKHSDMSREAGHEVMLHLPMEPTSGTTDPGPDALLQKMDLSEIRTRTQKNLDRFSGYVGVNNHMGSKFTAYNDGMAVVMDELASRGLLFLDSRTTSKSVGYQLARMRGMPAGNRDVFIDNEINVQKIIAQLQKAEKLAHKNGISIAIGHPYPETIEALSKWMPQATERGVQFVPVSAALIYQTAKRN